MTKSINRGVNMGFIFLILGIIVTGIIINSLTRTNYVKVIKDIIIMLILLALFYLTMSGGKL